MASDEKKKPGLGEIAHTVEDAVANNYRKVKQYVSSVIRSLSPADEAIRSPKKGSKMTLIEKGPSKVQATSPGGHRPGARKAERTASRSVEIKGKQRGRDTDLISSATSALRRLNFRSAGGSNPKRVSSSSPLPDSSTEATINTSIESAVTMYTTVTMTDAEQDDKNEPTDFDKKTAKDEALMKFKENIEPKEPPRRNRQLLIERIGEVYDENARLLNAQKSKMKMGKTGGKSGQGTSGGAKKAIVDHNKPVSTTVTIQHLYKGKSKKIEWTLKKSKQSTFVEDKGTNIGESLDTGASLGKISGGAHAASASPPRSMFPQEQQFFLTPAMLDENASDYDLIRETERLRKEKFEKPKSKITTIQSKMPQYTFSTNFNKRKKTDDSQEKRKSEEDTRFPFPPRNHSLDSHREMSASLRTLSDDPFSPISSHEATAQAALAPLTLANLEQHERNVSEEPQKYRTGFGSAWDIRSPSNLPCTRPSTLRVDYTLPYMPRAESSMTIINDDSEDLSEGNVAGAIIKDNENATAGTNVSYKRKKEHDERSASLEISDDDVKFVRSRNSRDAFLNSLGEHNIGSPQDKKYSVLSSDGSVKNYVSESGDELKKFGEKNKKENIKKNTTSKNDEYPQRHRRVSIIQGDNVRHYFFEEPDPSRMKPSKQRKVSKVIEDTTRSLLLEDVTPRITTNQLGDSMNAPAGDEGAAALENKPRKFSINTLGDIVSARKFSLLPPGEIYTSHVDGKTTEVIKLAPVSKGKPLATIVVQQASIQRGSISGPSTGREPCHLDVNDPFNVEELPDLNMSPHHFRSQSVKTPGRSCGRPNYLCLPQQRSRVASMPNTGVEEEFYRLRHFSITGKGLINRGDSFRSRRSRSNTSVVSSNSSHSTDHLANACAIASRPESSQNSGEHSGGSSRDSPPPNLPYRIWMLGACEVGKTTLVCQFTTSDYLSAYDASLDEMEERTIAVLFENEESEMVFVDRPYTEVLLTRDIYSIDAQAFVIVYSVVDRDSFLTAQHILELLWNVPLIATKAVILVANKGDLARSRTVTYEEGKNVARTYECKYIETSAGIQHNVDELLVGILSQIRLKLNRRPNRTRSPFDHDDSTDSGNSSDLDSDENIQLQIYLEQWFGEKNVNDSDNNRDEDQNAGQNDQNNRDEDQNIDRSDQQNGQLTENQNTDHSDQPNGQLTENQNTDHSDQPNGQLTENQNTDHSDQPNGQLTENQNTDHSDQPNGQLTENQNTDHSDQPNGQLTENQNTDHSDQPNGQLTENQNTDHSDQPNGQLTENQNTEHSDQQNGP